MNPLSRGLILMSASSALGSGAGVPPDPDAGIPEPGAYVKEVVEQELEQEKPRLRNMTAYDPVRRISLYHQLPPGHLMRGSYLNPGCIARRYKLTHKFADKYRGKMHLEETIKEIHERMPFLVERRKECEKARNHRRK